MLVQEKGEEEEEAEEAKEAEEADGLKTEADLGGNEIS